MRVGVRVSIVRVPAPEAIHRALRNAATLEG